MGKNFRRTLSLGMVTFLVLAMMSLPVHAQTIPPQERAYIMLKAGQYQQAAIPLMEAGNDYIASGNVSLIALGNEYLMLASTLSQSDLPQYQLGTMHTGMSIDCIEAILALIAAIAAFDAACVTPAIVAVFPCIGAIAALAGAADLVGRKCTEN